MRIFKFNFFKFVIYANFVVLAAMCMYRIIEKETMQIEWSIFPYAFFYLMPFALAVSSFFYLFALRISNNKASYTFASLVIYTRKKDVTDIAKIKNGFLITFDNGSTDLIPSWLFFMITKD